MVGRVGVTSSGLRRRMKRPIASLTLLAFFAVTVATPTQAQIPGLSPGITPGATGVGSPPPATPYTLGSGDRIQVAVFDVPEYSGEYVVLVDGTLNLPVIGSISVRGLTLQQATDVISSQYARFVRRPLITISLLAARPVVIAVAGEVQRPGTYSVAVAGGGGGAAGGPTGGQFPTVTQAITLAGGITQSAAVRDVQIRRRTSPTTEQVYNVNLWELLQGNLAQDVALRDGDSIFIPSVGSYNAAETRQLADASFAPQQIEPVNIAIIGEVARPGPYSVSGGGVGTGGATGAITGTETGAVGAGGGGDVGPPTVTKAIQVAGGITALADIRSITITRATRTGGTRVIPINLWALLRSGDLSEDFLLQDGDTIIIPTATAINPAEAGQLAEASFAPNEIVVNVVGEVEAPGAITVPPNTPLNQAVLAAGGFNPRSRRSSVDLIRLNDNGTVSKRRISVDLAQGINEEGNPTLRNNDVVVVRRNTLASVGDTLGNALNPVGSFLNIFSIFRTLTGD